MIKKIGIIHGMEDSFPTAFIDRINSKNIDGIVAERVLIDKVIQGEPGEFAVILDRISHDAPFYRSYLKNLAISGSEYCFIAITRITSEYKIAFLPQFKIPARLGNNF